MAKISNTRQELFCFYFVATQNRKQSAKLAGYSDKSNNLSTQAYKLMQNPRIIQRIAEMEGMSLDNGRVSFDIIAARLDTISINAMAAGEYGHAVNAIRELNKMMNYTKGREKILGENEPQMSAENMTFDQLAKLIEHSTVDENEEIDPIEFDEFDT